MKNYVISLQTATDRREHIVEEFGKQYIPFEFFDAITPQMIPDLEERFGFTLSQAVRLSEGEKACFASHVSLWQKMLNDNVKYVAIFEDDVFLGENANQALDNSIWLDKICDDEPFDIIKLETFLIKVHLGAQKKSYLENRESYLLKSCHTGTGGYILSSEGAKKLMKIVQSLSVDDMNPVDHLMFDDYLRTVKTYQIKPAVCIQGMFLDKYKYRSCLDVSRSHNTEVSKSHKRKIHPIRKLHFTLKKLYRSLGKRTFFKVVEFK